MNGHCLFFSFGFDGLLVIWLISGVSVPVAVTIAAVSIAIEIDYTAKVLSIFVLLETALLIQLLVI